MKVKFLHTLFLSFSNDSEGFSHRVGGKKTKPKQQKTHQTRRCPFP